jgi:hypothetical protein
MLIRTLVISVQDCAGKYIISSKVCVWIFVADFADKMPSKQVINAIYSSGFLRRPSTFDEISQLI